MELILTVTTKRSPKCIQQLLNQAGARIPTEIKKGQTKGTIESNLFKFKTEWELNGEIPQQHKFKKRKPNAPQNPP